jgi:hypothetical protein
MTYLISGHDPRAGLRGDLDLRIFHKGGVGEYTTVGDDLSKATAAATRQFEKLAAGKELTHVALRDDPARGIKKGDIVADTAADLNFARATNLAEIRAAQAAGVAYDKKFAAEQYKRRPMPWYFTTKEPEYRALLKSKSVNEAKAIDAEIKKILGERPKPPAPIQGVRVPPAPPPDPVVEQALAAVSGPPVALIVGGLALAAGAFWFWKKRSAS